jgi:tetratricopeptide (TPR) repeat protein
MTAHRIFGIGFLNACMLAGAPPQTPPSFDALTKKADAARDAGRLEEALQTYKKALRLRPAWDEGWWAVGSIAYDLDKWAECAPAFQKLAKLKPDMAPAWTMLGMCEYRLKKYEAALASLLQADRLGFLEPPEYARLGRLHLALVLTKNGSFERAVALLTDMTRGGLGQKTPETITASGIAGLRRPLVPSEVPQADRELVWKLGDAMSSAMEQKHAEAMQKFEEVVSEYPNEPNIHFRFGAYLMGQDPERGIAEIQKTLELDPKHIPAMVSLASIYLKRGDMDKARQYAETAVQTAPGDFASHIMLGRVKLETDDAEGAAKELEIAVRLAPGVPEAHFNLASAYARLGRKADANREREEFRRLKKLTEK